MAKKATTTKTAKVEAKEEVILGLDIINSEADLKSFLLTLRDKLISDAAPPVFVLSAMNHVLKHKDIYSYLSEENKELAREIWLQMKQEGLQLKNPPMFFGRELADGDVTGV